MERLLMQFKLKDVLDDGKFTGYLAVKNNVDRGNDRIVNGAFKKTIQENPQIPILWQHFFHEPIGVGSIKEDQKGLFIEGNLVLDVQRAREAHALMKSGAIKGLSFGYLAIKKYYDDKGVRVIQEVKVFEGSIVTIPMNPLAEVESVKALAEMGNKFAHVFSELNERAQLSSARYTMLDVLNSVLNEALYGAYDGTTPSDEEVMEHVNKTLDEFKAAILAWFPQMRAVLSKKSEDLDSEVKEGRVLSTANRKKIQDAFDVLKALLDSTEPGKSHSPTEEAAAIEQEVKLSGIDNMIAEFKQRLQPKEEKVTA